MDNKPNNKQLAIIKRLYNDGKLVGANIKVSEHEVYCYLPIKGKTTTIIAIHVSGLITNHVHTTI